MPVFVCGFAFLYQPNDFRGAPSYRPKHAEPSVAVKLSKARGSQMRVPNGHQHSF
jgi:hypothetical protein